MFSSCYGSGTGGTSPFCNKTRRNSATGLLISADDGPLNLGALKVDGLDVGARYSTPLSLWSDGRAGISLVGTYLFNFKTRFFADDPASEISCAGQYGSACGDPRPRWKANTQLFVRQGPVTAYLIWNWIGATRDAAPKLDPDIVPDLARRGIGSKHYFDLNAVWDISKMFQFRGGVENLFNLAAPRVGIDRATSASDNSTFPGLYDAIGRRFFIGARVKL